jgi:hypothetical protein
VFLSEYALLHRCEHTNVLRHCTVSFREPDIVIFTATRCVLSGPGIGSRCGKIFYTGAEVNEKVELYFYSPVASYQVVG